MIDKYLKHQITVDLTTNLRKIPIIEKYIEEITKEREIINFKLQVANEILELEKREKGN